MQDWFQVFLSLRHEIFWPSSNTWLSRPATTMLFRRPMLKLVRLWKHHAEVGNFLKMRSHYRTPDAVSTALVSWREEKTSLKHTPYPKNSQEIIGSNLSRNDWYSALGKELGSNWFVLQLLADITLKGKRKLRTCHGPWPFWPLQMHTKAERRRGKHMASQILMASASENKFEVCE